jgi:acid phosphatase type 7
MGSPENRPDARLEGFRSVHHPSPHRRRRRALVAVALLVIAGSLSSVPARAAPPIDFQDGFESGNMSAWTTNQGIVVQQTDVFSGSWAARAQGAGTKAFATVMLPSSLTEVFYRVRVKVVSNAQKLVLLKLRRSSGVVAVVGVNANGTLFRQNKAITGGTRNSATVIRDGSWHELVLHVRTGASGLFEVSLDGVVLADLTRSESVGTAPIIKANLGESATGRTYHVVFDDVLVDDDPPAPPVPDDEDPTPPGNLRATSVTSSNVVLAWDESTDNVGVAGYNVYRDGVLLDTTTSLGFTDATVEPSTQYDYTVEAFDAAGNTAISAVLMVETPADGGPIVLRAAGDIACDPEDPDFNDPSHRQCAHRATADLLAGADAVIAVGDLQYQQGTLAEYLASYDPSWGVYRDITYPAAGDGEYETPGAAGYYAYWGAAAHEESDGYYSFDLGSWHVVILNSVCGEIGGCGVGSPQYEWLDADLQADSAQCTLAALHVPVFASRNMVDRQVNDTYKPLFSLLDQHEAEIVLAGNSHFYERFARQNANGVATPTGVREFLIGTGGKSIGGLHDTVRLPTSEAASKDGAGVLELRLGNGSYAWDFLPVPGNPFTDSGFTSCH